MTRKGFVRMEKSQHFLGFVKIQCEALIIGLGLSIALVHLNMQHSLGRVKQDCLVLLNLKWILIFLRGALKWQHYSNSSHVGKWKTFLDILFLFFFLLVGILLAVKMNTESVFFWQFFIFLWSFCSLTSKSTQISKNEMKIIISWSITCGGEK